MINDRNHSRINVQRSMSKNKKTLQWVKKYAIVILLLL